MNSSRRLSIIFLSLSGILIAFIAIFAAWVFLLSVKEEYPDLTVMRNVLLILLVLSILLFFWLNKYTRDLIRLREDETRQVEKKLVGFSARLTSFMENPEYVSIYSLDRNYRYTSFNSRHKQGILNSFGGDVKEGDNFLDQLPEELAKRAKANFDRALKGEHFTVTSIFNDRYFTQVFNPVYDENDEITGLTCNIFDVTDRIKAEQELESYRDQLENLVKERTEQLERQTLFFQKIIDNLPNLIFVRDINHRYILVNKAMADSFGCNKEDLIGEGIDSTHHDYGDAKQFEIEDDELILDGGVYEEEGQHTWPDGSKKWLFLSKRRMEIAEDKYVLGVHFDITYLKDTEHKLQEANDELKQTLHKLKSTQLRLIESEKMASLGQLTAGLAHEINNPINYVAGNVAPIREDLTELKAYIKSLEDFRASKDPSSFKDPGFEILFDELESLLAGVDEGTARVKSLMNDLHTFSLPEGSRKVLYDINESLQSTINLVQHHLKSRIKLDDNFNTIPETLCNPQQLNQVFLNILNNAIQAIEDKGRITVYTEHDEGKIIIRISDTGVGIPEENLGRIFDPFFTTKDVGKGTGLGLAISYRIIEDHGGTIEVQSALHKGTSITISLPVVSVT